MVRTFRPVRISLAAVTLVLVACGGPDRHTGTPRDRATNVPTTPARPTDPSAAGAVADARSDPDALVLRIARAGGPARVYPYGHLDSAIWTSTAKAPSVARVLAFDDDEGSAAVVDARGALRRIDLRSGDVSAPTAAKLVSLTSRDGSAVYGINPNGSIARFTPTDATPWTFTPTTPARDVAPRPDGTVIIVSGDGSAATRLWRVHPPEYRVLDSAELPAARRILRTQLGDRVYLVGDSAISGVRGRDLQAIPTITFPRRIRAVAATPSGDRLYVALDSTTNIQVVDRYTDRPSGTIDLPGAAIELRMDPLGRYLLVRPMHGDSAWIVAVGTDKLTATIHSAWSPDLPFVGPDGEIAVADFPDVDFVDPTTGLARRVVTGGARDFWIPIRWNGFRPRAAGLDQPVTFPNAQSTGDSTDTIARMIQNSQRDSAPRVAPPSPPAPIPPGAKGVSATVVDTAHGVIATRVPPAGPAIFTVQFAAVLNLDAAQAAAAQISVGGRSAQIVAKHEGPSTIYHVVLGPYPTRAEADAAGQAAHHQFWIYQGAP
jgi:DNA-binding beta-propeller fold protein YncE